MDVSIKTVLVGLVFLGVACCAGSKKNEFVVKKKKEPTIAQLKEACCRESGDVMAAIPELLVTVAQVQTQCLSLVCGALEGDSESFCERASKKELALCLSHLEAIHEEIAQLREALERSSDQMNTVLVKK